MNKQYRSKLVDIKGLLRLHPWLTGSSAKDPSSYIRNKIRRKEIPFIKIKGRIFFHKEMIEIWLEGWTNNGNTEEKPKTLVNQRKIISEVTSNDLIH